MNYKKTLQLSVMLASATAVSGARSDDRAPYQWTCKAQGYYEMKVMPDGKVAPIADTTLTSPISVVIRPRSKDQSSDLMPRDMTYPFDDRYVVGFTGAQTEPFSEEPNDGIETSGARFYTNKQGLHEVVAMYWDHYRPHILTLAVAEKDWYFTVYSGGMTTDVEARHLSITLPSGKFGPIEAMSNVYFMTGPCIRDQ